jgi:hypothetical protein
MKSETVPPRWDPTFAVLEANRRLTSSQLQEAALTSRLTGWLVGLTVAMAVLIVLLAVIAHVDPVGG